MVPGRGRVHLARTWVWGGLGPPPQQSDTGGSEQPLPLRGFPFSPPRDLEGTGLLPPLHPNPCE